MAYVPSWRIFTLLTADPRSFRALVDIGASFAILEQFVSWIAFAIIRSWRINTTMPTLIELSTSAFIYIAMSWLIATVITI